MCLACFLATLVAAPSKLLAVQDLGDSPLDRPKRTERSPEDFSAGARLRIQSTGSAITYLAFAVDGKVLAARTEKGSIILWNAQTGQQIWRQDEKGSYGPVSFSPDGKTLAGQGKDNSLCLWDAATGRLLHQLGSGVTAAVFVPDGTSVIHNGEDGAIWSRDVASGQVQRKLRDSFNESTPLAVSADGKTVLISTGCLEFKDERPHAIHNWLEFRTTDSGELRAMLDTSPPKSMLCVSSVALSRDGRWLATSEYHPPACGVGWLDATWATVRVREIATGKEVFRAAQARTTARGLTFTPDNRFVALEGPGGIPVFLDLRTGKPATASSAGGRAFLGCLALSMDGKTAATACRDGSVLVWHVDQLLPRAAKRAVELSSSELRDYWSALSGADAKQAYRAAWAMVEAADQATDFIRRQLRPARPVDNERLARLITDLEDANFTVRCEATRELELMGSRAEFALRDAMKSNPLVEVQRRAESLLKRLQDFGLPLHEVRDVRALAVLEQIGTRAARDVVKALSEGAPEARRTREAKATALRVVSRVHAAHCAIDATGPGIIEPIVPLVMPGARD
jgi:WD40 repeat protein